MKDSKKRIVVLLIVLLCLLAGRFVYANDDVPTYKRYGKNIFYYDFSKIPDNLVLDRKIELPKDLKEFLDYKYNNPMIENPLRFEQEAWEEAHKLGYTLDNLKNASFKEAIMAAVEIVVSRLTYHSVDWDENFIRKYGKHQPTDVYFHLKLGDCDKYRDATIGVFDIIKKLNPRLQNVYLSNEKLGSNHEQHAWISIVIPQDDYLILSHIDPTFYDNYKLLEAGNNHICLEHNIFIGYFYNALSECDSGYDSLIYAYQILEEKILKVESKKWQEKILYDMSFIASLISIYKPRMALDKIRQVLALYEAEGFTENLDGILAHAFDICLEADEKLEAEKYKQRLLKEFPDSFRTESVKNKTRP